MDRSPALAELVDTIVVLRDHEGREARFVVDHASDATLLCSYVFRGRHLPPTLCDLGHDVAVGAPSPRGWLAAHGTVHAMNGQDAVVISVEDVEIVQRRNAHRENVLLPFLVRRHPDEAGMRGRTDNLSMGGFAARVEPPPIAADTLVLVTFDLPDREEWTVRARKLSGDMQQRFAFVDLSRRVEDRFARLVRAEELANRRAAVINE